MDGSASYRITLGRATLPAEPGPGGSLEALPTDSRCATFVVGFQPSHRLPLHRNRDAQQPPGADKTRLPPAGFPGNVGRMSAVELAVKKVKKLSAPQARELLGWLDALPANGSVAKRRRQPWWRRGTARQRMKKLRAWEDSVRGTTDWEIPRMPDDLVRLDAFPL